MCTTNAHSYQPLNLANLPQPQPPLWILFCSHCGEVREIERPKAKE